MVHVTLPLEFYQGILFWQTNFVHLSPIKHIYFQVYAAPVLNCLGKMVKETFYQAIFVSDADLNIYSKFISWVM